VNDRQSQHPSFTLTESDAVYFGRIPSPFLKLLKLIHFEKMNYREIAAQTDLPAGTVKSRVFRGREIIRKLRAEDEARNEKWQEPTYA
jgi:DNA-directed RNA polymerase specialized sigma24 family protein